MYALNTAATFRSPFADVSANRSEERAKSEVMFQGHDAALANVGAKLVVRHLVPVTFHR